MADSTNQGTSDTIEESESSTGVDLELVDVSRSSVDVRRIAVGAVLAALSVAVAPTVGFIARVANWGIALFDHVSIFWMVAFLIGGPMVGSISLVAGGIALFPFDPFSPFGPIFKMLATMPMMLVPWYGVKRLKDSVGGEALSRPKFYATLMVMAILLRVAIMVPVNIAYLALFAPVISIETVIMFGVVLNVLQGMWDALIPFIVVYPTGLFENFKLW